MARPGEFELIERYFAPMAGDGSFGLRDDAALLSAAPGSSLVVTQDAIAAGIHFFADDPPASIARKALRVNLSDLAAKGARPLAFSLALGLPGDWREEWLAEFASGLSGDCARYGITLSGGDTFRVESGPVIAITAWGEIAARDYASRAGAGEGDELYVTGTIGLAALGLRVRSGELSFDHGGETDRALTRAYLEPEPPVAFAPAIAAHASAAIDISDGFAGDVAKLARASGVDVRIRAEDIPLSPVIAEARFPALLELALTGGDDYQIAFTALAAAAPALHVAAKDAGIILSRLGTVRAGSGALDITSKGGAELRLGSGAYVHFGEESDGGVE
jgi:thiamine-monophosphate kinase